MVKGQGCRGLACQFSKRGKEYVRVALAGRRMGRTFKRLHFVNTSGYCHCSGSGGGGARRIRTLGLRLKDVGLKGDISVHLRTARLPGVRPCTIIRLRRPMCTPCIREKGFPMLIRGVAYGNVRSIPGGGV